MLASHDSILIRLQTTTVIGAALITTEVLNGLGRHEFYLEPKQRRIFQAVGWADWIQTFITLCMTKVSICLFLLRIVDSKRTRLAMYSTIVFTVLFTAVSVCLFLGVCRPLKAYWDVGVDGTCLSDNQVKNIVIAQGGLYHLLSRYDDVLMNFSSICYHGSDLRFIPHYCSEKPAGQVDNEDRAVHSDGLGSHYGGLLHCAHRSVRCHD